MHQRAKTLFHYITKKLFKNFFLRFSSLVFLMILIITKPTFAQNIFLNELYCNTNNIKLLNDASKLGHRLYVGLNSNNWLVTIWSRPTVLFINRPISFTTVYRWKFISSNYFLWGCETSSYNNNSCCIYIWKYVWLLGRVLLNTSCYIYKSCLECLAKNGIFKWRISFILF